MTRAAVADLENFMELNIVCINRANPAFPLKFKSLVRKALGSKTFI
jgi:hypothetical protein